MDIERERNYYSGLILSFLSFYFIYYDSTSSYHFNMFQELYISLSLIE